MYRVFPILTYNKLSYYLKNYPTTSLSIPEWHFKIVAQYSKHNKSMMRSGKYIWVQGIFTIIGRVVRKWMVQNRWFDTAIFTIPLLCVFHSRFNLSLLLRSFQLNVIVIWIQSVRRVDFNQKQLNTFLNEEIRQLTYPFNGWFLTIIRLFWYNNLK